MKSKLLLLPFFIISLNAYSGDLEDALREQDYITKKIEEHSMILDRYENNSHYYGRSGLDLHSHTKANLLMYKKELVDVTSKIESLVNNH